jgi:hypothetical protein
MQPVEIDATIQAKLRELLVHATRSDTFSENGFYANLEDGAMSYDWQKLLPGRRA